jgi:hypothetical protein
MADVRITQKAAASLTYTDNWAPRLAAAYGTLTPVTITSASGVASAGTLTAVVGSGTAITFHLATTGITPAGADLTVTLTATLSNGDSDPRVLAVGVV